MSAQQNLIDLVQDNPGIQAVELITKLTIQNNETNILQLLRQAVNEKKIIELEYIVPNGRIKSRYFPANTVIRLYGQR